VHTIGAGWGIAILALSKTFLTYHFFPSRATSS
jgi:hypothetical protein